MYIAVKVAFSSNGTTKRGIALRHYFFGLSFKSTSERLPYLPFIPIARALAEKVSSKSCGVSSRQAKVV